MTERLDGGEKSVTVCRVGDVTRYGDRLGQGLGGRVESYGVPAICNHLPATVGKGMGEGSSESSGCAAYQRDRCAIHCLIVILKVNFKSRRRHADLRSAYRR